MTSRSAAEYNDQGLEYLRSSDAENAVKCFAMSVQLDPEFARAWYGKGCAHGELEEYDDAIHAYQQSAKFGGDKAALPLFNLGNLYQRLGEIGEAAKSFHQAVQADPTMADGWINLGRILDDSGDHNAAIECYDIALKIEPADLMAWSNRGNSLRGLEQFQEALDSFEKALELDPSDFVAVIGRGACLIECGQPEDGLSALVAAVEETQHPMAMFEFGTALAKLGQHEKAVVMYDTLLDNSFETAEIWNNRGECLAKLNKTDEALSSFDSALEHDESYSPALFGKARVLVIAERLAEARPVTAQYLALVDDEERSQPAVLALIDICGLS